MSQQLSRNKAKQLTLAAQAAAIVFAGAAVAVAGLGVPGLSAPDQSWADSPFTPGSSTEIVQARPADTTTDVFDQIDPEALAQRLSLVDNSPVMPVDDSIVDNSPTAPIIDDEPDVVAGDVELRFLGLINEPKRRVALMAVEGRQRFLAEGDITITTGGTLEVLSIASAQVRVELDGIGRVITRNKSNRPSVTMIDGGEVNSLEVATKTRDRAATLSAERGWASENIQPGSLPRGRDDVPESVRNRRARIQEAAESGNLTEQRRRARENANQEIIRRKPNAPNIGGSSESAIRWSRPRDADDDGRSPPE